MQKTCSNCDGIFKIKSKVKNDTWALKFCSKCIKIQMESMLPQIKEYRKIHSLAQTKKEFNLSQSMLSRWGVIGPDKEKKLSCPDSLSDIQQEIITGNLLGDGSIPFLRKNSANSCFRIIQKKENIEYVKSLFDIYRPYSNGICEGIIRKPTQIDGKVYHDLEHWRGEYSQSCTLYTMTHPVFTDLRKKWYTTLDSKGGRKIVPSDVKLTWRTAAFWACDDGCNVVKNTRSFILHTDCFTSEEVEFLIIRLKQDLGIAASLIYKKGKPLIRMGGEQQVKFVSGIKEFIPWSCFSHKCLIKEKTSLVSLRSNNTSGFLYISWNKKRKKWVVQIKGVAVGGFSTLEEAVEAKEKYLQKL